VRPDEINYIVWHVSATEENIDIGFEEIDKMHRARGWNGCGYHFIIRINGVLEIGRNLDRRGAHVGSVGHNHDSWGICIIGGNKNGKPANTINESQLRTLEKLTIGLKNKAPDAEVLGHRDLSPDLDGDGIIEKHEWMKECPCFDARNVYSQMNKD